MLNIKMYERPLKSANVEVFHDNSNHLITFDLVLHLSLTVALFYSLLWFTYCRSAHLTLLIVAKAHKNFCTTRLCHSVSCTFAGIFYFSCCWNTG